jgi:type I pantothenate kinase
MPFEMDFPLSDWLRARSAASRTDGIPYVIGVAGSVAVGKSTFAHALRGALEAWHEHPSVESVATDGYLFPNRILAEREITMRKGFPESYDFDGLHKAVASIKRGKRVTVPLYSHVTYDIDAENSRIVHKPDIVILDGLHLAQIERGDPRLIDMLIYLDAQEEVIERWFTDRLVPLMEAGVEDSSSFYYAFRAMGPDERRAFAARVWQGINLPNLRDHIVKDRAAADLVLYKASDHRIVQVTERHS